ncbi:MAG: low specificity L-threonine aldolase [Coriobacteriia bacterium]|nr:low specificity L-threonine aldolase [Coriobacteriia bacterium]
MTWRGFGSDNHAGVHPRVLDAIAAANDGHAIGYGDDPWTERATELIREHLGPSDVAFTFNGTGANCVAFAAVCRSWESVVCPESAHINEDECGAPERVGGVKLVPVHTPDGKLTPDMVRPQLRGFDFEHHSQPRVISVSNVSELGTVYTAEEIKALADLAHENGMLLHVDGARLANAAASLGCSLRDITADAGVDVLSFGGTKNGMLAGEAVVLFGDARTDDLKYVRKQSAQLASKMRFIAAQFTAMLEDGLWLELASHANAMARRLAEGVGSMGIRVAYPVEANEVFADLPDEWVPALEERFRFYTWGQGHDPGMSVVRWVTSWDTREEDVDALLKDVRERAGSAGT